MLNFLNLKQLDKINTLLTFDYELPLGGLTKSFDHSLFEPAQRLLDWAGKNEVPIVLFADILSYIRFKQKGIQSYVNAFERQLQNALKAGHDVQLHLHPHWLESEVEENIFYPAPKFRLADFDTTGNGSEIRAIIKKGIESLQEICREVKPDYQCVAYRGEGYNLEPRAVEILGGLFEQGIRFDSTVVPGYFFVSRENKVDFRKVPQKPNWFLPQNGDLEKEAGEGLLEVPVPSIPKGIFEVPTAFKLKRYDNRKPEARGPMIHTSDKLPLRDRLKMLMANRMLTVDNYTYEPNYLNKIFDYHVNKFSNHTEISLALIGHPKSMGDYSFYLLDTFLEHVKHNYDDKASFNTFNDLQQAYQFMNSNDDS